MSLIRNIEAFQSTLVEVLLKDLNFQSLEQLYAFVKSYENSERFQPFEPQQYHDSSYSKLKNSLTVVGQYNLESEICEITNILKNLARCPLPMKAPLP